MSWHDIMYVMLTPDWVGFSIRSPLRWSSTDHGFASCVPDDAARPWEAACAALSAHLSERMRRGLRLSVTVSDRMARYQILPWRQGIVSRAEWRAYAMNSFESVHGEAVKSWRVKIDLVPPGRPSLACAIDNGLIDALRTVAVANGSRLVAIRPNFVRLLGERRQALRGDGFWFGAIEQNQVCLGVLAGGEWRAIRNETAVDGWQAALPGMVRRIQAGIDEPSTGLLNLCGDLDEDSAPASIAGMQVRVLDIKSHWARRRPEQNQPVGA